MGKGRERKGGRGGGEKRGEGISKYRMYMYNVFYLPRLLCSRYSYPTYYTWLHYLCVCVCVCVCKEIG